MPDKDATRADAEEPWACTCGGIVTDYGEGHTGNCAVMQWHDLQVTLRLRADLAASRREVERLTRLGRGLQAATADLQQKCTEQLAEKQAENERLREALRTAQIIYLGNQGVCRACGAGWTGHTESHAPGCLAALSAQGQQEPTWKTSGG